MKTPEQLRALDRLDEAIERITRARLAIGREPNQSARQQLYQAQNLIDKVCVELADGDPAGGRDEP